MADKQLFGTDGQSAESEKTEKITPQSESDEKEPPEGAESAPDEPPAQGNMQPSAKENVQPPAAPAQTPDCPPLTFTIELTTQPTESDSPQQAEPTPPPTVTPTPEPTPEPDPVPTPDPVPEPTPVPAFDVPACVQNAVNYGTGIGLVYDSTATACWDDPLTANAQSLYTERDLRDRLDWYMASGFTSFCVWSETVADGSYLVYIGYA